MTLQKIYLLVSVSLLLLANIFGAFGAHALKPVISPEALEIFKTGVQYQFYHGLGLLFLSCYMAQRKSKWLSYAGFLMILGCILFSGSLYLLSVAGIKQLGWVTPIGGIFFIAAWGAFFIGALKSKPNE